MAAGLGVGVDLAGSAWWQAAEPLLVARANPARAGVASEVQRRRADGRAVSTQSDVRPPGEAAVAPARVMAERPPVLPPPPIALVAAPEPEPDVEPPATTRGSPARPTPPSPMSTSAHRALPASSARPFSAAMPRASESGAPFDAALGSILYAPDRRLAVVDGRIVKAGDEVRGARVVDIAPRVVLLRDAQGRMRRLALGASGP
jgi:hypothetical protein